MQNFFLNFKFISLILIIYILVKTDQEILANSRAEVAQIYDYKPNYKISANIGINSQNRINFGNYGIREIVGEESLYQIIHDSHGYNIFIIPKVLKGEVINISIIGNNNYVQDLELKVTEDYGQTIIIRFPQHDRKNQ
ncbi:MAG UNVERIFIED_CONTAM: hypothetical protein LVQ98_01395 [Rickettsiaceae bacterium]|jgi:hypothetical protein